MFTWWLSFVHSVAALCCANLYIQSLNQFDDEMVSKALNGGLNECYSKLNNTYFKELFIAPVNLFCCNQFDAQTGTEKLKQDCQVLI